RKEQEAHMIQLANRLNADPATAKQRAALGDWTVVSRRPERVLKSRNLTDSRYQMLRDMHGAEVKSLAKANLRFTLIPAKVLERIDRHLAAEKPTDPVLRGIKRLTGYERHVALYSNPRWPIGLHQENAIRLAAINTSPLVVLGKKLANSSF